MNLTGKIALVTGGTRGIGAATALVLVKGGAQVAIVGRRADKEATHTRDNILAMGGHCEIIQADCARPDEAQRCVQATEARLGPVDVLVHSAGGPVNGGLFDLSPEAWAGAFDVHVHAVFHLCRSVIPGDHFGFLDGGPARDRDESCLPGGEGRFATVRAGARARVRQ